MRAAGVDVSHWHTVRNWRQLEGAVRFLGVKATEGEHEVDPAFRDHQGGFRASTLDLAIYFHFAVAGDPVAQARHFAATVGPLEPHERLCLDLERDIVSLAWVEAFFGELVQASVTAAAVDLWAPRYSDKEPVLPSPWARWTFWQWSERELVAGIDGQCDANWFNGDDDELRAYAEAPARPLLYTSERIWATLGDPAWGPSPLQA